MNSSHTAFGCRILTELNETQRDISPRHRIEYFQAKLNSMSMSRYLEFQRSLSKATKKANKTQIHDYVIISYLFWQNGNYLEHRAANERSASEKTFKPKLLEK